MSDQVLMMSRSTASSDACRFFLGPMGCRNGSQCPFRHQGINDANGNASAPSRPSPLQPVVPTTQVDGPPKTYPCKFYQSKNGCKNGEACSFIHEVSSSSSMRKSEDELLGSKDKAEDAEEPISTRHFDGPFFAIDVECIATGYNNKDRAVARIAVIDEKDTVVFDQYVKPEENIVSYLTPLTGITESDLKDAKPLNEVLMNLRQTLPSNSIIVGQSIEKDLDWLGLKKKEDFSESFDIANLFRVPAPQGASFAYRKFSLRHVVKHLMDESIQEADHDPVVDALWSMKVFLKYRHIHESPDYLKVVRHTLCSVPKTPSFAERTPFIDGVAMSKTAEMTRLKAAPRPQLK